jgi:hypothetical protein
MARESGPSSTPQRSFTLQATGKSNSPSPTFGLRPRLQKYRGIVLALSLRVNGDTVLRVPKQYVTGVSREPPRTTWGASRRGTACVVSP